MNLSGLIGLNSYQDLLSEFVSKEGSEQDKCLLHRLWEWCGIQAQFGIGQQEAVFYNHVQDGPCVEDNLRVRLGRESCGLNFHLKQRPQKQAAWRKAVGAAPLAV